MTPQLRQQFLQKHNELRMRLARGQELDKNGAPMPPATNIQQLTWSCRAEMLAQEWANHCNFKHSTKDFRRGHGENLYMSYPPNDDAIQNAGVKASVSWWDELPELYSYNSNPNNTLTPQVFNQGVGHWTQMAWAETNQLGCAVHKCPDMVIVVCEYYPPGNTLNRKIYETAQMGQAPQRQQPPPQMQQRQQPQPQMRQQPPPHMQQMRQRGPPQPQMYQVEYEEQEPEVVYMNRRRRG